MYPLRSVCILRIIRAIRRVPIWPLPFALWLLLAAPVSAQGHALVVTVRDVRGGGVSGVSVSVRDDAGRELAQGRTDGAGAARFADLPAEVRVAVAGRPRGGPPLVQLGGDALGVRISLLEGTPTTLDLRVEPDGLVLPDPATMISRDVGGPTVGTEPPIPTAAIATPAPLPTAPRLVVAVATSPVAAQRAPGWAPLISVLLIVIAAGALLALRRRRADP